MVGGVWVGGRVWVGGGRGKLSELLDTPNTKIVRVIICSPIYYAMFNLNGFIFCISVNIIACKV